MDYYEDYRKSSHAWRKFIIIEIIITTFFTIYLLQKGYMTLLL